MKNFIYIISFFSLLFSCSKVKTFPPLTKDQINGKSLWNRIVKEEDFNKYPEWPNFEGMQLGQSPHGRYHIIYINSILRNSLPLKDRIAPEGSIIVKKNFDADKQFINLTVMAKVKGYDPKHNDWFWIFYDKDGKIKVEGKVGLCIECHEGLKENDYIIVRPLDEPLDKKE